MPYIHNKLRLGFPMEAESALGKIYRYKYEFMFHMALSTFHCYRKLGNFISPSQFSFHLDSSYGCLLVMTVSQNLAPIFISFYLDTNFGILHLETNVKLFFSNCSEFMNSHITSVARQRKMRRCVRVQHWP